jgi:hypothetical protein
MGKEKEVELHHKGRQGNCSINEFNLDDMVKDPACVMIAKRGSGKSVLVREILLHFSKKIPMGIIISPTDEMNRDYSSFVPESFIYNKFDPDVVKQVLDHQKWAIEKEKERVHKGKKFNSRAFIVMDDCLADKGSWAKDPTTSTLLMNGRHYHIMYILTMQFPLGIKPELRGNFDYVFLLADDTVSNQKRIYDHYAGMFPNFDAFRQVFEQLTSDYGAMVIVNRGVRKNFLEKIYYYKAQMHDNIKTRIGCGQYNKFHEDNFEKDWIKKIEGNKHNPDFSKQKMRQSKIKVDKIERLKRTFNK